MKNTLRAFGLFAALLLAFPLVVSAQVETPAYSNALVVSIDPARRILVVRNAKGRNETLVFDDLLQSTGSVKAGDRVIVTVRGGPGRRRVSAISVASATTVPARPRATPSRLPATGAEHAVQMGARDRFSSEVATVSENARSVDVAWASFVTTCSVKQPENTGGGRDWFGLWDGRVQADYSGGACRELFNQIISSGELIKRAMAAAEATLHDTLDPGAMRDIRRLHNMNWDGWTLAPPAKREP